MNPDNFKRDWQAQTSQARLSIDADLLLKEAMAVTSAREKANKTAIRYVVYWTLGIIGLLALDMFRGGIVPENWIPMTVAISVLLVFGIWYLRTTTWTERRRDAIRKLADRTYE